MNVGRDNVVCIETHYGLDGPGIESRWKRHVLHPSKPVLGPTQPRIEGIPGHSRRSSDRGVALTTHPIYSRG